MNQDYDIALGGGELNFVFGRSSRFLDRGRTAAACCQGEKNREQNRTTENNAMRHFASLQFGPLPVSTASGTESRYTDSISVFTNSCRSSFSSDGASKTSSSCTCSSMRDCIFLSSSRRAMRII